MSISPSIPEIQHFQNLTLKIQGQGQMTMMLHNYRSRQFHRTSNGINPSSGFRDMRSAQSGPDLWQIWQVFAPWASPYGTNGQMTMTMHSYRPRQFHRTLNGENPSNGYRDGFRKFGSQAPARPPKQWWQYSSSLKGWGVKLFDTFHQHIDGLVQERHSSIAKAMSYVFLALTNQYQVTMC